MVGLTIDRHGGCCCRLFHCLLVGQQLEVDFDTRDNFDDSVPVVADYLLISDVFQVVLLHCMLSWMAR